MTATPTIAEPSREEENARGQPPAAPPRVRCLAIIPAFNEEKHLGDVIEALRKLERPVDVLVIDDGSMDRTAEVARAHGARVLTHPFNLGYGVALQTAYKFATREGYDALVQLDGDGQHDTTFVVKLLDRVASGQVDVCVGSRFLEHRGYYPPFARRVGMVVFGFIASWATGRRVTDPTSGFQALSRRAFSFFTDDIFPFDYPDADVLILLHRAGFKVEEIAVGMKPSPPGKLSMHSGLVKPLFYVFKMFLSIAVTLLREKPRVDRNTR